MHPPHHGRIQRLDGAEPAGNGLPRGMLDDRVRPSSQQVAKKWKKVGETERLQTAASATPSRTRATADGSEAPM